MAARPEGEGRESLRTYLYRLLLRHPCTRKEAADRLAGRGGDPNDVRRLVTEFEEMGLIDDENWARLYVEGHSDRGAARLRHELRQRGVAENTIDQVLEEGDDQAKAEDLAAEWSARGLEWKKIAARLVRRGFSSRTVSRILRNTQNFEEFEEFEEFEKEESFPPLRED
jgi:regulatory protein